MSATAMAPLPLGREGQAFWEELIVECKRYAAAINGAVSRQGFPSEDLVACGHDRELQIRKSVCPSTCIKLAIEFFPWGPVIIGTVTGRQAENLDFSAEEWEIPLGKDLDGSVVAIFNEGRSFSPGDLARYVAQTFRRCYPAVSLPCECNPASC